MPKGQIIMRGVIEKIRIYPAKGTAALEPAEARLVETYGLEGDYHAKGGERQVSLFLVESKDFQAEQKGKALCLSRFKGNLYIRGLTPEALRPGAFLLAGEAALEITGETKHCHEECELFETGKTCSLAGLNLFAKVRKGGLVCAGGEATLVLESEKAANL